MRPGTRGVFMVIVARTFIKSAPYWRVERTCIIPRDRFGVKQTRVIGYCEGKFWGSNDR